MCLENSICRTFILLLCIIYSGRTVHAQVVLDRELDTSMSIHPYVSILKAENQALSLDYVLANQRVLKFEPVHSANENLGFTEGSFWLRFSIQNASDQRQRYVFETARPLTDTVILYILNDSALIETQWNGDAIPFQQRKVKHRNVLFRLDLQAGEKQNYFVEIKSDGESLMLPLNLHSEPSIFHRTYQSQIFYGFFYGILMLASIIYLFFYFALRDATFLYYSLYVIFIGLLQFALDGFFFQYVMPSGGFLYNRSVLIIAIFAAFFLGKYGEAFLKIPKHLPRLHIAFRIVYILLGCTLAAILFIPGSFAYGYPVANALGLLILIFVLTSIVHLRLKRIPIDGYFVVGIAFLVLGFVAFILNNFNAISNAFLANNGPKIGTGLEVVFLSISMSNLIRLLRIEKDKNQQLALQRFRDMNDIKSSFISNISHELRTPLNLIMGVAGTQLKTNAATEQQEPFNLILQSSRSLLHSIDDILSFTVIEKGGQILKHQPFLLNEFLNNILSETEIRAAAKGLMFKHQISDLLPPKVIGDHKKLEQILSALLDNAIKFTDSGSVELKVSLSDKSSSRCQLIFEIIDTGTGISNEKMNTIFESFTKKSFEDKREFGGLGLGLYIARNFVDLMEGEITLKNIAPHGVNCRVTIWVGLPETYAGGLITEALPPDSEPKSPVLQEIDILYVEDNEMNQMVMQMLATGWEKCTLTMANNGLEGLDAIRKRNFDVVLMDLQMPVMDGFEAIERIRSGEAGEQNKDVPIITVSADVTESTKQRVFELGANAYMTKPIDGEAMFATIQKCARKG